MKIRENIILAPYTTFGIGGPARYFVEVESVDDLKIVLNFSRNKNLKFFILGGGSNVLISDEGFDGLVIKMCIKGLEFNGEFLSAGAGENWDHVVGQAVEKNLGGIENLSLIPGTVGAAIYQNIGAYGVELKDVLGSVEVFDAESGEIKTFTNGECGFGYRDSFFKSNSRRRFVILRALLRLSENSKIRTSYPDLAIRFEGQKPSIFEIRNAIIDIRKRKLPYPNEISNAGSFFKNPTLEISNFPGRAGQFLISKYPDLKRFHLKDGSVKLSAAQLIEKLGWKGKTFGNVGVSEKHSLVLVNYGKGTAEEVINLADNIKASVKNEFGVELEPEVEIVLPRG